MIFQLLIAFGLACLTVIMHAFGTSFVIIQAARIWQQRKIRHDLWSAGFQIAGVVGALLLLHLLEAGIWALFYFLSGDLPDFETAIYFSITSYTTVGYGDVVLPVPWRILGPFESAVGILMFGWSTAIIIAVVTPIHGNRLRILTEQQSQ